MRKSLRWCRLTGVVFFAASLVGGGCRGAPPSVTPASPTPSPTTTATVEPTLPAVDPGPTPFVENPEPPSTFASAELREGVSAETYLPDSCEFLRLRWDPEGSAPGTVVLPIMYHSLREPDNMLHDGVTVSTEYFEATIRRAQELGFQTITIEDLEAFLIRNARIPSRSMIFIVDDRFPGAVAEYILPAIETLDWTVTLAWPIGDTRDPLWRTMEGLAGSGRLDVQSHGFRHEYITETWSDAAIREEVAGGLSILEAHFGRRPTAFVWPGGNFTRRSVEIAREEGYRLGFTASSRGPLLFNWIPLGDPERAVQDPLMVLPRAWSPSAIVNLEHAVRIGEQAAAHAEAAFPEEAAWYRANCEGERGAGLPSP
ncbi:MAG TPA: polysaccharide deacetylase family protein [Anaerolineales bacterium]|nr:polysaccharide deacetylase family protein [Anaerolineales bacterium]